MDLKIIPYTDIDGIPTFRDSDIMVFYDRMVDDGSAGTVFYAGHIRDRESFLHYMKRSDTLLYALLVCDEIQALTWLDSIEDRSAFNHFCVFKSFWGQDTVSLGKATLSKLIQMGGPDDYVFDVFLGKVPAWNQRAIDFAVDCGGVRACTIPSGIWNADRAKSEDAVVIYYTRENLK